MEMLVVNPKKYVRGTITAPGDKSISHRAIMFASLANGRSVFTHFLQGEDCLSTIGAFKQMGVSIAVSDDSVIVDGVGIHGLQKPEESLYLGNSGTTMRLLSGILAAQPFTTVLTGDASLESRPMNRIIEPLARLDAEIDSTGEKHTAPLTIHGKKLHGAEVEEAKGSAQVKSAILLAGMFAEGVTTVIERKKSRDHTERMMQLFGAPLTRQGNQLSIRPVDELHAQSIAIPGDISSAVFFIVAALILPDSEMCIKNVGINSTRSAIIDVLKDMGANIELLNVSDGPEPTATIIAKSSMLRGVSVDTDLIPFLIDELPILMIAAACAKGTTRIEGAAELRVKETDRIHAMSLGLRTMGVHLEEMPDGVVIQGGGALRGDVEIDSFHDHRIAMSFSVAALRATGAVSIAHAECVAISFPNFYSLLDEVAG